MKPSGRSSLTSGHRLKLGTRYKVLVLQALKTRHSVSDGDYEDRKECSGVEINAL
jgi:hypothetical protein